MIRSIPFGLLAALTLGSLPSSAESRQTRQDRRDAEQHRREMVRESDATAKSVRQRQQDEVALLRHQGDYNAALRALLRAKTEDERAPILKKMREIGAQIGKDAQAVNRDTREAIGHDRAAMKAYGQLREDEARLRKDQARDAEQARSTHRTHRPGKPKPKAATKAAKTAKPAKAVKTSKPAKAAKPKAAKPAPQE